ncbi:MULTISPECIES: serine hydrolase [Paenibacillus]|uniref:D-alanyl-D-alanine carboxypeptidase n=2 Tax=Paenibacillus TaxID=44249 RepID=A0ABY1LTH9_9BACL|nr:MULTISPECIES: serine hydrolase [Paenibacillus]SMF00354.1 D-alanyl-D-alanine carboxypeptidase [Paenibacillus barengoltzii J12]
MTAWTIAIGLIVLIILLFFLSILVIKNRDDKKNEEDVLKFIKHHPKQVSCCFVENGNPIIAYQSDQKMPLASVLKIMVAIEFVRQTRLGKVDPNQEIPLAQLDRFYIPGCDGGAHAEWLGAVRKSQPNRKGVSYFNIAKGMIQFSSNANTEFLMEILGIDAINHTVSVLGDSEHEPIFPISSAGLIGAYLMDHEQLTLKEATLKMKSMSPDQYKRLAEEVHRILAKDTQKEFIVKYNRKSIYNRKLQLSESSRMPSATANLYGTLLERLQRQKWFDEVAQKLFMRLMEREVKEASPFEKVLSKGGASISILNNVFYVEDKQKNRLALALLIHEPTGTELIWLRKKMQLFIGKIFSDPAFRTRVAKELNT